MATSNCIQVFILLSVFKGMYAVPGIESELAECKTSTLPVLISLLSLELSFHSFKSIPSIEQSSSLDLLLWQPLEPCKVILLHQTCAL